MLFTRKKLKSFFFKAITLYVSLCIFMFFYQRHMMYFPDKTRPNPVEAGVPDVEILKVITQDGLDLEGWYFEPADSGKPVIVFFHGNAGNFAGRGYKVARYIKEGYGVLLAEYRGYGGNPGKPSEFGFYSDGRAYLDWLQKEKGVEAKKIVLYGESIGTGVVVQMASERDVAAVVLEAPYSAIIDIAREKYFFLPLSLLMRDQFRSRDRIGQVKAPLLFIQGGRDDVVPIKFGKKLFEAAHEPKTFITISQAGHNNLYEYGAGLHVLEFLSTIPMFVAPLK